MVDLITSHHAPARLQPVVAALQEQVPTVKALVNTVAASPRSRNVKTYPISGPHFLRETLCGLDFRVSPRSFFQTNTRQTEVLYSIVALLAGEQFICLPFAAFAFFSLVALQEGGRGVPCEVFQ